MPHREACSSLFRSLRELQTLNEFTYSWYARAYASSQARTCSDTAAPLARSLQCHCIRATREMKNPTYAPSVLFGALRRVSEQAPTGHWELASSLGRLAYYHMANSPFHTVTGGMIRWYYATLRHPDHDVKLVIPTR